MGIFSDEQLVVEYIKGDEKSLELLIQRYLTRVYQFALKYLRNKEEAEDIAQEVFVKVWKNAHKFKADFKFKTWIYTITKNACLDWLKKKNRPIVFSALDVEKNDWGFADSLADRTPSALDALQTQEGLKALNFAVEELPPIYRNTVNLRYREDLKFREIAEVLRESVDTIKTRHRRAIKSLKNIFQREKMN
ncbi:MAG TPA: RNA polymerase sigma factor [Candidatus Nanoarchaeia archaeon]|nr:RNA polymerase sigma factor [Candidatus Nanoarchaeia archaeon]